MLRIFLGAKAKPLLLFFVGLAYGGCNSDATIEADDETTPFLIDDQVVSSMENTPTFTI